MTRRLWYVGLEDLNARYTGQLCRVWAPRAFDDANAMFSERWEYEDVAPPETGREISVGRVLDAVGRGVVSLHQMSRLAVEVGAGRLRTGDVVYLQDFWTPGLEALLYALHMHGVRPRIYARCFAQSVDEYDFTWPMRSWMRPVEVGWSRALSGMFVASEVHRQQLRAAGFECPVHVTGLPFDRREVGGRMPAPAAHLRDLLAVAYTSRLDAEKNPWFMLEVARRFLAAGAHRRWTVTTSAARFPAGVPGFAEAARELAGSTGGRFAMLAGLDKDEYYATLSRSAVQFNCSLQDYVAFTMLEAAEAGCDLVYPAFRSFPECVNADRLYEPFDVQSALACLERALRERRTWPRAPQVCHAGFRVEMALMLSGYAGREVNVWHEPPEALLLELAA